MNTCTAKIAKMGDIPQSSIKIHIANIIMRGYIIN